MRDYEPSVLCIVSCSIPFMEGCRQRNELGIREWNMFLCSKRSDTNLVSKAAVQTSTPPYWNIWLFLALPAVWLAWSLIFFIIFSAGLLSFIWTSGDRRDPDLTPFTDDETMKIMSMPSRDFIHITLTVVFTFGLNMGWLVMRAFRAIGANRWVGPKSSPYMTTVVPYYSLHAKVCDPA